MSLTVWQLDPAQMTPYYNLAFCNALAQQGCTVRYIASRYLYDLDLPLPDTFETDYLYFRGLEREWLLRYPRLRKVLRAFSYALGHRKLAREIELKRPDIVHFQWSRLPFFDYRLIRHIKQLGIPVVHTVHDVVPIYERTSVTSSLSKIYSEADAVMVHAEANKSEFMATYPDVLPERIYVIPHLALENAVAPPGATQQTARTALGISLDVPIVLFFGSIKPYKGLDVLIEAFRQAKRRRPDLHLLIAGRPEGDSSSVLNSDSLSNIILRPEYIPGDEIWKYHLAADVAVLPYRHIYQSGALSTAMAFGLPVIVSNVGGLPEAVDGNGWVVPSGHAQTLADIILEACQDLSLTRLMGTRSLELIQTRYSGQQIAEQTIRMYREVLGERAKGS